MTLAKLTIKFLKTTETYVNFVELCVVTMLNKSGKKLFPIKGGGLCCLKSHLTCIPEIKSSHLNSEEKLFMHSWMRFQ